MKEHHQARTARATADSSKAGPGGRLHRDARGGATATELVGPPLSPWSPLAGTHRSMFLLSAGTVALLSLIFAPLSVWPVSFVCTVPWLIMVGTSPQAPRVYLYSYALALVFFLVNMRWLYAATGVGYVALSVYLAAYFPVAAIALRHAVRRRRWPLAIVFPVVWSGCELLRAVVMSGFPWFFLSHSFHGVLTLIQISDLVGAYGVTFMAAAVNGALADGVFTWWRHRYVEGPGIRPRQLPGSVAVAVVIVLVTVVYGWIQLHRGTISDGPKIAVVQGDFLNSVYPQHASGHDRASDRDKMLTYLSMLQEAAKSRPDLYLLPETPWIMYLNPEARDFDPRWRASFEMLQEHATRHRGVVVTGSATLVPTPEDLIAEERRYNSATIFRPDGREPDRYDKVRVVPFGETVPFRFGHFRFLYFWLNYLMPFSGPDGNVEYSIFPGEGFRTFQMKAPSQDGKEYRFGVPICYEDVMPYISREFVAGENGKDADFLLNISNDGWFGRGIQQPQHLAICVFRAVENRVGIARAVNTGVSAFIEPDGRVRDIVEGSDDNPWPGRCGFAVARVGVDSRFTLYSRYGDWFAWGCVLLWAALFVDYWITRARTRSDD